jgi:hypothetical protein
MPASIASIRKTGTWDHKANMPANWDLEFWNDSLLVSGLNSADYQTPNAIFLLDTSGQDQHRKIVETGGNSAGLAVDSMATYIMEPHFLQGPMHCTAGTAPPWLLS